ncbi:alpha/beta hydrolase [Aerococcus viridans]|uniref:alpha/beta hydrolase n=1 Tax=Aerococcus viridans TaxID=1377 RepID=UPI002DB6F433|nr:alpha/beta hydrolase [Aerococcus viridans]MEB7389801.1 alpha/beta hydrolase [Aerococcus viridans]
MKFDIEKRRIELKKGDAKRDAGLVEPMSIEKFRDISYGPYGIDNTLDVYYPIGTSEKLPTLIHIHGGGFFYGDKELYRFYTMFLATQGFTVVNFNYRLAPDHIYPSPLEDINRLVEWTIDNNKDYFIDLDNLFLLGDSAGGQLAQQYATIVSNPYYQNLFDFQVPNIQFNAVGLNCGAYYIGNHIGSADDFPYYLDGKMSDQLKAQLPVEQYITSNFPPAFVMTSSHDFLRESSIQFGQFLISKGNEVYFKIYRNTDDTPLNHVFHIDQKSSIARKCNLDQLNFFSQHIH